MTLNDIHKLIAKGETRTLELKKTTGELRRGTMEAWGRGISVIMAKCLAQGLPEPEIKVVPNFVNLTIWFSAPLSFSPQVEEASPLVDEGSPQVEEASPLVDEGSPQVEEASPLVEGQVHPQLEQASPLVDEGSPQVEEVSPLVEGQVHPQLEQVSPLVEEGSPQVEEVSPLVEGQVHPQLKEVSPPVEKIIVQDKIIDFCRAPKSITEISEMLGVSDKSWVRRKYINPLIGVKLQRTLPDKPTSKSQKYQTIE